MSFAIETENLVKVYGDAKTGVRALDGINMKVPKGSVYGLFGPNGSGKTTLISILVGLLLPNSGTTKVLGYDATKQSVDIRRKVGLLPEGFGLYDHMTALENMTFLGSLDDMPPDQIKSKALEVLELVGLKDKINTRVSTFSRGMKQRMGVAQALLKSPELLIFDEPTVGIDPDGAMEFRNLVRETNRRGTTVLMSTHLLYEVGMICTHAGLIRQGRLLAEGTVDELSQRVKDVKGYTYEIRVKASGDLLLQEIRTLPEVREVTAANGKLIVIARSDIGDALFSLTNKAPYQGQIESLTPLSPSWEDVYQFYERGE